MKIFEKIIFIDVSDKEALWRISGRTSDREDETLQAIRERIKLFHKLTEEVLAFYKDKDQLIMINGEQEIDRVYEEIVMKLGL